MQKMCALILEYSNNIQNLKDEKEAKIMWYFEAHYANMDTCEEITRKISFDGQFFDNEKECYMYAMSKAYDMQKENECLESLEFLAC